MSDGPEWFAHKRYGYGSALPISWQGWAVTLAFIAIAAVVTTRFAHQWLILLAIMVPLFVLFMVITAKTTRGGWRWRWGEED